MKMQVTMVEDWYDDIAITAAAAASRVCTICEPLDTDNGVVVSVVPKPTDDLPCVFFNVKKLE